MEWMDKRAHTHTHTHANRHTNEYGERKSFRVGVLDNNAGSLKRHRYSPETSALRQSVSVSQSWKALEEEVVRELRAAQRCRTSTPTSRRRVCLALDCGRIKMNELNIIWMKSQAWKVSLEMLRLERAWHSSTERHRHNAARPGLNPARQIGRET